MIYKIVFLILFFALFEIFSSVNPSEVKAAVSHYVQPVIFYPNDRAGPTQAHIDGVNFAMNSLRFFMAQDTGKTPPGTFYGGLLSGIVGSFENKLDYQQPLSQTFEVLSPKIVKGLESYDFYKNSDLKNCAPSGTKTACNIFTELGNLEIIASIANKPAVTGLGFTNRIVIIFPHNMSSAFDYSSYLFGLGGPFNYQSPSSYAGVAMISTFASEALTGNVSACTDLVKALGWSGFEYTCNRNLMIGMVAHEIGHAFLNSHDVPRAGDNDLVNCDQSYVLDVGIMCGDLENYPTARYHEYQRQVIRASIFSNPPANPPLPIVSCFTLNPCVEGGFFGLTGGEPVYEPVSQTYDCCRVNLEQIITKGGYIVEVCGKGIDRSNAQQRAYGCAIKASLVGEYSTTLQLKPLDASGNALRYDIYVDYQTIHGGIISWKEIKNITALCYSTTCPYKVSWAKPKFKAKLYKANTDKLACEGYSNCVDTLSAVYEDKPIAKFTGLPPKLKVDMKVEIQPYENTATWNGQPILVTHWFAEDLETADCSNNPTSPSAVGSLKHSLSGTAGSESVALTWNAPVSWGNECGQANPREYIIDFGTTNPPPVNIKVATTSATFTKLLPEKRYYWRVNAENAANMTSSSSILSFDTLPTLCTKADVDDNGSVGLRDIMLVQEHFGETKTSAYDVNSDGYVDLRDTLAVSAQYGQTCW